MLCIVFLKIKIGVRVIVEVFIFIAAQLCDLLFSFWSLRNRN